MNPARRTPTGAVFVRTSVINSEVRAWVAAFTFFCNGIPYEYYFVIGNPSLTEQQARDTMENKQYIREAQKMFLEDVIIAPIIH